MVKCEICGSEFKNNYGLTRHIVSRHKEITTKEYYEQYIPKKLCGCGCGQYTPIKQGTVRADFILGHNLIPFNRSRVGVPRDTETKHKIGEGRKGKPMPKEAKLKISKAQKLIWTNSKKLEASQRVRGENHPNWKGGRPKRDGMYVGNTRENVIACRERDNNTCQMCGATKQENYNRNMSVHHIIPYYDSFDNSLDNLICLCRRCHSKADRLYLSKEEILNYYDRG